MEQRIKEQLFGTSSVKLQILEEYELSELYTPETVMEEYKESLILELKEISVLAANMFSQAEVNYEEGNVVRLELLDTIVSEGRKEEIMNLLDNVFRNRFHMNVDIRVTYKENEGQGSREYDEQRIQQEINAIFERRAKQRGEYEERKSAVEAKKKSSESGSSSSGEKKAETSGKTSSGNAAASGGKKEFKKKEFRKKDYVRPVKIGDDPNLIYGKNFEDEPIKLEQVVSEMGEITIHGKIINFDTREIRNEKTIIIFAVTDFTDTITIKMFARNDQLPEILGDLKKGAFVKIKGVTTIDKFDGELTIGSITGIKKIGDFTVSRQDLNPTKRVELHCHTKMSDMDGVSEVTDIVRRAHDWGHPAIAITDHGVAQAFPVANHYIETLDKDDPFKVLYGVEGYVVDDLTEIAVNAKDQTLDDTYIVFDIETTGFSSIRDRIIEIGAVKVENGQIVDKFSTFVNPERPIPFEITNLTSITDEMVLDAPTIEVVLPQFLEFIGEGALVAHNAGFDVGFIEQNCRVLGLEQEFTSVDTVALARVLLPTLSKYKLNLVAKALGISLENHHRAVDDAGATAEIFVKFVEMLKDQHIMNLKEMNKFGDRNVNAIRKMPTHHIILIAQNDIGRYNLYQLITASHMTYYARRPRIPKSLINEHREGIIIGSACEAGELYRAVLEKQSSQQIARLADFYDYYEIQPIGNDMFMLEDEKTPNINTEEDLRNVNREIVELGEKFGKPVVATCDVHFLDPEDEVYRRIIMAGKGFKDADNQAPLFLRTTDEMLEEFAYLGSAKAREVVIENPQKIARMVEKISPVNPNKCPPVIADSDQELRDICYRKAHEMYGEDLPVQVSSRLEKELNSIISNGYAVMYIIAQKLVWKSNADGYLVGSRGSVGSSFVATMSGITEVNPLSPHYYCEKCHYSDFDSEEVRAFAGGCGYDMPDRMCPKCGAKLIKAGFDIPFETFLGFNGDKEPDIDLNFSGEYQARAHRHAIEMFGETQVFRAGTIGTLAEKTAFGFVKKYLEENGIQSGAAEIDRLTAGCVGVRRTTGQHPGGLVVVPDDLEIEDFCPVQHPADAEDSDTITTHFEYHCMEDNLLKLDMLGHDDPTMIRMLEDLTGVNARTIPLDDPDTMSIFTSSKVLGFENDDLLGPTGAVAIPEFNTRFTRQMLIDTQPKDFNTLVRLSGFSHGTDVWLGNARELIVSGTASVLETVGCRDDIMLYLISMGLDPKMSFKIMEAVRKGKVKKGGFQDGWVEAMQEHDVPEWYIESLAKIGYLFPKAHAVAYVMMAFRIAWFKVHEPLAFYATFFTVRAKAFDAEYCCAGLDAVKRKIREIENNKDASAVEQDLMTTLEVCYEFYRRGFHFDTIDIYRSDATKFTVTEGGLLPPFISVHGLGEAAALDTVEKRRGKEFISVEEFSMCCNKLSKTHIEQLRALGAFAGMADTSQLTLFG